MPPPPPRHRAPPGPTQRQLRAGELVRHALVEILRVESFTDPALQGHPVTLTQVRVSPDLKHALCYVEPLTGEAAGEVIGALNRAAKFLRGRLGHEIEMKFTPALKFVRDESFDAAEHISRLLADPGVRRDVDNPDGSSDASSGEEPV
jgi:ribosome-binding factor A